MAFSAGSVLWVRADHGWWPARVCSEKEIREATDLVKRQKRTDTILTHMFGPLDYPEDSFLWTYFLKSDRCKLFSHQHPDFSLQVDDYPRELQAAIDEANAFLDSKKKNKRKPKVSPTPTPIPTPIPKRREEVAVEPQQQQLQLQEEKKPRARRSKRIAQKKREQKDLEDKENYAPADIGMKRTRVKRQSTRSKRQKTGSANC